MCKQELTVAAELHISNLSGLKKMLPFFHICVMISLESLHQDDSSEITVWLLNEEIHKRSQVLLCKVYASHTLGYCKFITCHFIDPVDRKHDISYEERVISLQGCAGCLQTLQFTYTCTIRKKFLPCSSDDALIVLDILCIVLIGYTIIFFIVTQPAIYRVITQTVEFADMAHDWSIFLTIARQVMKCKSSWQYF